VAFVFTLGGLNLCPVRGGEFSGGSFVEGLYKIAISRSAVIAQNAPQTIWRPGTARTPDGGAYSAPINHQRV